MLLLILWVLNFPWNRYFPSALMFRLFPSALKLPYFPCFLSVLMLLLNQ
jgi:hypothetical protein